MTCDHSDFNASVSVGRLTSDRTGEVVAYSAEVQVTCSACGERFTFVGLPGGSSPDRPTVALDGCTLRAPIQPVAWRGAPLDSITTPPAEA